MMFSHKVFPQLTSNIMRFCIIFPLQFIPGYAMQSALSCLTSHFICFIFIRCRTWHYTCNTMSDSEILRLKGVNPCR